jgi:hypothetical protein
LLLDTNVLLLLYVGLVDRAIISRFKRTQMFAPEDFDMLRGIVARFEKIVTTPHILTEVSNLADRLTGQDHVVFWRLFRSTIAAFDERHEYSRLVAGEPVFSRLGLTDTAISRIASAGSVTVLTVDVDLWAHLLSAGVVAHNFNHVRVFGWR